MCKVSLDLLYLRIGYFMQFNSPSVQAQRLAGFGINMDVWQENYGAPTQSTFERGYYQAIGIQWLPSV